MQWRALRAVRVELLEPGVVPLTPGSLFSPAAEVGETLAGTVSPLSVLMEQVPLR